MRVTIRLVAMMACASVCVLSGVLSASSIPARPPADRRPATLSKPRIEPLPETQWTLVHRQIVAKFAPDGHADNELKTLLNVPEIAEGVMPLTMYLSRDSGLASRHRDILILRTAWLVGTPSLWASQARRARESGLPSDDLRRIAEGPNAQGWMPFERTLVRAADQMYRNSAIDDATWKDLAAQYELHQLIDAVETVTHFTFLGLLHNAFGVQPDEGLSDRMPASIRYRIVVREPEPPLAASRIEPAPGQGIAVGRTYARHPRLNAPRGLRGTFILSGKLLSPRHREMLILRIGWNCRSEYEWAQHVGSVGRAREHGVDPLMVARGPDAPGVDPFDAAVLRIADELYHDAVVSTGTWNTLATRFDTPRLMSAVYTVAAYRAVSVALNTYGVQFEPESVERFPKLD